MTIDEVIAHTREVAAMNKERAEQIRKLTVYHDIDYAAEHKKEAEYNIQIADWLEELKAYRDNDGMSENVYKAGFKFGYNTAIDDFTTDICNLIEDLSVIKIQDVDEIAEQLKESANE